jgi:sec-independent protein translocase protein TatC
MNDNIRYLLELRKRLLIYLAVLLVVFILAAVFANQIYQMLAFPLLQHFTKQQGMIAISIPAPFLVPFKAALVVSLFLTMPFLLYQIWTFIAPALYRHERQLVWLLITSSSILFYLGILFAYFIILPIVFKFFIASAPAGVEVKPDINLYFKFIMEMFFAFGFAFEVPVAIVLLVWSGITTPQKLAKKRPYVILAAFILGMLLTPPDVISQILLAVPLWLLFELGLLFSRLFMRRLRAYKSET